MSALSDRDAAHARRMSQAEYEYCRRRGRAYTWGVAQVAGTLVIAGFLIASAWDMLFAHDDCDKDFWHHCGADVITDAKTGVQYLTTPSGGIIERKESK